MLGAIEESDVFTLCCFQNGFPYFRSIIKLFVISPLEFFTMLGLLMKPAAQFSAGSNLLQPVLLSFYPQGTSQFLPVI